MNSAGYRRCRAQRSQLDQPPQSRKAQGRVEKGYDDEHLYKEYDARSH
jgi:hypothetical protein